MIKKILVPLDGSANAEKIAGWSEGLAEAFEASFVLLSVVDPEKIERPDVDPGLDRPLHRIEAGSTGSPGGIAATAPFGHAISATTESGHADIAYGTQVIEAAAEAQNRYVNDVAKRLSERGFQVRAKVAIGKPEDEIVKAADEEKVDIVAMATHRGSAIARGVLGSVTDRVVHATTRPVLVIRPETVSETMPTKPQSVIVPLDGSEESESVLPIAKAIAKETGAELVAVRVTNLPYMSAMGDAGIYYASPVSYARATDFAAEYLEPLVEQAKNEGVKAVMRTPTGGPANTIVRLAEEIPNAMVVIGTRGQSGFRRWVVGSVADKVIRTSGRPVLVVPPPEREVVH